MDDPKSPYDLCDGETPFRTYYRPGVDRWTVRPELTVGAHWTDPPNTRGEPITAEIVASLIDGASLGFLCKLSEPLAWNLQLMKETDHWPDVQQEGAVNPASVLRRDLPKLIPAAEATSRLLCDVLADPACPERNRRERLLAALAMFVEGAEGILQDTQGVPVNKSTAHWHEDAYFLAVEIYSHAREIGATVALSKPDSAGVQLISQLLDLAFVNHSGSDAIAKELNRRRSLEPFLRT